MIEDIADQLRSLADRLEQDESERWPSPWDWHNPHREVVHDASSSGYDLGVDGCYYQILIHHDGYVKCVHRSHVEQALEEMGQPGT